jgi:hypothetical protein
MANKPMWEHHYNNNRKKSLNMSGTMSESGKKKVLFLRTGNSCRSQMAEALTNRLKGGLLEAYNLT